jgi:hypothetical protein
MNGTTTALCNTAAILGTGKPDYIAQHPKQRGIGFGFHRIGFTVNGKIVGWHKNLFQ